MSNPEAHQQRENNKSITFSDLVKYFAGVDVLKKYRDKERLLLPDDMLPTEVEFNKASKIYSMRLALMFEYPFTIFARITGVDALRKGINNVFKGKSHIL